MVKVYIIISHYLILKVLAFSNLANIFQEVTNVTILNQSLLSSQEAKSQLKSIKNGRSSTLLKVIKVFCCFLQPLTLNLQCTLYNIQSSSKVMFNLSMAS